MNYAFFGTPEFAAIVLEALIQGGLSPRVVVANPDRPAGRKKVVTPPPIKILAQKFNIPVLQPESLSDIRRQISDIKADFFVVAAYGKILSKEILNIPRLGAIGVHPSLLPKYRGSSPIQTAILEGERETGVTLYLMDEKVDHGPIIAKRTLHIAHRSYEALLKELADTAGDLLIETLPKFMRGEIRPEPQDESRATFTKKFLTNDAFVDKTLLQVAEEHGGEAAMMIERKIWALNPEPGVYTIDERGERVKLLKAEILDGKLKLKTIQRAGRKPQEIGNSYMSTPPIF